MYLLYHDKDNAIITVKKASKAMQDLDYDNTGKVNYFNNHYFICLKRKPLLDKAREMKEQWLEEEKEKIMKIEAIEIK